ncbi:MAG: RNA polymerase sigma factor [Acidimicrobiales bacterium]
MTEAGIDPELAALCHSEYPRLVGMLALYLGDRATAEDLAQETLVRLHQHWPRIRTMPSVRAWVSTVAFNLARSWWRRRYAEQRANRRHAATGSQPTEGTESGETPSAAGPEHADVVAVRAAIAALPPRQRAALVLRYYAELSVSETAAALGCATGTVKSLTHSAINTLRVVLDDVDDMIELEEIHRG